MTISTTTTDTLVAEFLTQGGKITKGRAVVAKLGQHNAKDIHQSRRSCKEQRYNK